VGGWCDLKRERVEAGGRGKRRGHGDKRRRWGGRRERGIEEEWLLDAVG